MTGFGFARIDFNLHVSLDFLWLQKIGRSLNRYKKYNKNTRRLQNKTAKKQSRLKFKLLDAKKHVVNLSTHLSDAEYILLSRGLKFIPSPPIKFVKQDLLKDFGGFCRILRCRYLYHNNMDEIHPFQLKSGYRPHFSCNTLENYIFQTRHELSSLQIRKFRDNLSILERKSILSLLNDKNGNCVILDKVDYLSEVHRQLST